MNRFFCILLFSLSSLHVIAQTSDNPDPVKTFPEIKGYVGIVHPLYTFSKDGNQPNFRDYYLVGNPWGINIWKSKKVGISFECTPFIRFENNTSKLSNFVFHPACATDLVVILLLYSGLRMKLLDDMVLLRSSIKFL